MLIAVAQTPSAVDRRRTLHPTVRDTDGRAAEAILEVAVLDDPVLGERSRDEEVHAFGVLFDRHAPAVHQRTGRRDDVLTLVFLEAWAARRRVVLVGGSARMWLLEVTDDVLADEARVRRRHRAALARSSRDGGGGFPARRDHLLGELRRRRPRRVHHVLLAGVGAVLVGAGGAAVAAVGSHAF